MPLVSWYDEHRSILLDDRRINPMTLYHPATEEIELSAVLHALSDPQRLQIVRLLAAHDVPVPCGSLSLDVTKSTATHHFRVLREAGVVHQVPSGTSKLTTLRRSDLDARLPGLLDVVLAALPVGAAPALRRGVTEPAPYAAAI
jgi:DNA-binding transcriptional ArsR family regulator